MIRKIISRQVQAQMLGANKAMAFRPSFRFAEIQKKQEEELDQSQNALKSQVGVQQQVYDQVPTKTGNTSLGDISAEESQQFQEDQLHYILQEQAFINDINNLNPEIDEESEFKSIVKAEVNQWNPIPYQLGTCFSGLALLNLVYLGSASYATIAAFPLITAGFAAQWFRHSVKNEVTYISEIYLSPCGKLVDIFVNKAGDEAMLENIELDEVKFLKGDFTFIESEDPTGQNQKLKEQFGITSNSGAYLRSIAGDDGFSVLIKGHPCFLPFNYVGDEALIRSLFEKS